MCSDNPQEWVRWLPLAEYWYNTTYHSSTGIIPFEALYGQSPPTHIPYLSGSTAVDSVDRSLQKREEMITLPKEKLNRARNRMKQ